MSHSEEPSSTPEPGPSGMKNWLLGGVGAVAVVAASIFGISAATNSGASTTAATADAGSAASGTDAAAGAGGQAGMPGGMGGTAGTIDSIEGSTITLTDQDGASTSVVTTDDTTYTSTTGATVADLAVGDNVRVNGTDTSAASDGSAITADRVTDSGDVAATDGFGGGPGGMGGTPPTGAAPTDGSAPAAPAGDATRANTTGTITSIDGSTMVVTTADGATVTVTLSDSTTVSVTKVVTLADLAAGDTIMVRGEAADDGTVTATSITEGTLGGGFGGAGGTPPANG